MAGVSLYVRVYKEVLFRENKGILLDSFCIHYVLQSSLNKTGTMDG